MKPKKKSLQKLTKTDAQLSKLFALETITTKDFEHLSDPEKDRFMKLVTERFSNLKGDERDDFYRKIEQIASETSKNDVWENNQGRITGAIANLITENNRMPTKAEIAEKTGFSRQTIHKHLKEYATHPIYLSQLEQYRLVTSRVLASVFQLALRGDVSAAKLYFNVTGAMPNNSKASNTLIQNQNNFIQINGTVLSQEAFENLNPEQLNQIERILKADPS